MKYLFLTFAFILPISVFAQNPSKVDSAQLNVGKTIPPQEAEPSIDEFIEASEEPKPMQNIQSLVVYPEKAKRAGLEGKVMFSILIGKDGNVRKINIDHADYDVFRQPVIDAMQKVKFIPAKGLDGKPMMVWYTQTINFKLKPAENDTDHD